MCVCVCGMVTCSTNTGAAAEARGKAVRFLPHLKLPLHNGSAVLLVSQCALQLDHFAPQELRRRSEAIRAILLGASSYLLRGLRRQNSEAQVHRCCFVRHFKLSTATATTATTTTPTTTTTTTTTPDHH